MPILGTDRIARICFNACRGLCRQPVLCVGLELRIEEGRRKTAKRERARNESKVCLLLKVLSPRTKPRQRSTRSAPNAASRTRSTRSTASTTSSARPRCVLCSWRTPYEKTEFLLLALLGANRDARRSVFRRRVCSRYFFLEPLFSLPHRPVPTARDAGARGPGAAAAVRAYAANAGSSRAQIRPASATTGFFGPSRATASSSSSSSAH